ncbi:MAG: CCA tRNA nucleotidyltransferase [Candidatus Eisenbacteria bacterium]|uniref:CCA tRNA nucleotidyltransferase n=1 Tax=Eiseniibacteriota bacterium TaxID=2212470 RepID=A0A849SE81_UNCEI|nr:CCA tRNA nucleotidyltransferase [Candidatus Eisenbacteria bacterium]
MHRVLARWFEGFRLGSAEAARLRAARRLEAVTWPADAREALLRLQAGGAAGFVGGTVRDRLLGRESTGPLDVACALRPEEVRARFERVVDTGLRHGTVTVWLGSTALECTTFRREGTYGDARRPDSVSFTLDPQVDLDRRDLTVNALYWDPIADELLDPHDGASDLERRTLRAVGDPLDRFREDALRPLRVARFRATLEMEPDDALWDAVHVASRERSGVRFEAVSPERVRDELMRTLVAPRPSRAFELLSSARLLDLWIPELARCRGVTQNRHHAFDVFEHSLRACDAAPRDKPRVRWAALLHDLGKPETREGPEGAASFHGHASIGAERADRVLERLRFPSHERSAIVLLVREHMFELTASASDAALRRWLRRVGIENVADLFDLRLADALATGVGHGFPIALEALRARIQTQLDASHALAISDLAIDGADVMRELELAPGPRVGEALVAVLEAVLEQPELNTREQLLAMLRARRAARA